MRALVLVLVLGGCAESLHARDDEGPEAMGGEVDENGVATRHVDATSSSRYVAFDLDSGSERETGWDLSFSRFRVRLNGGASGGGHVYVSAIAGAAIEDVTQAPEDGYVTDHPNASDGSAGQALLAGDGWYAYDEETHVVSPRDVTYVVRTTEQAYFALQFTGYYDEAGTGGVITFRSRAVEPPAREPSLEEVAEGPTDDEPEERVLPAGTFEVDATNRDTFTYLIAGSEIPVAEDAMWDLGFRRTQIRTHGGASAVGEGGAMAMPSGMRFEDVTAVPADVTFASDVAIEGAMPGDESVAANEVLSDWFDYDLSTHTVAPKDLVYLVRGPGGVAKLRIEDWRDGIFYLRVAVVEEAP